MFGYVYGSSGLGKTQLAFALKAKTLYVPMGRSVVTRTTVF
jgi:chromosomal replication initiation ATPase DnaA